MPRVDRPRVLLVWPGGLFGGGANFGVPQMLGIAASIRAATEATVDVVDLDMERAFGQVDLAKLVRPGYDLIGLGCYSSFDYLKVMAIGARLRELAPRAWLVTGGYHVSARPDDFTGGDSPFDYAIVGDGETPMARLASALVSGKRPLTRVIGPEPTPDPNTLAPYDWSLLERYRPVARKVASQAEIYLSRGCPYDCAFCMERAKRDVSWRSLEPARAVEEMHRLDGFLDLSDWTLFVADALFGMKRAWRREMLEELIRRPIRARKTWLLIRLDLIEREDLELMKRANVAPGFGLESGDPEHLRTIRKAGKLEHYLEHMLDVASWARELDVPFGANIIIGHPGETEATMRTTARYMRRLFLEDARGTTGFLSVDPFRLYPGSPIDEQRAEWEARTGMRVHRYPWWHDGDQEFLSEWVDPSGTLDFRRCHALRHELFAPIVREIKERYSYGGPARDYFMRAIDEQIELVAPKRVVHTLGLWHLWTGLVDGSAPQAARARLAADDELAAAAKGAREATAARAAGAMAEALREVPRERFVPIEHVGASADDVAIPLDDTGAATVSAMHAYVASFDALALSEGDELVDLGGGTGYGAAIASRVVGASGHVTTIEIDPALSELAAENLAGTAQARVVTGDAHDVARWRGARKVTVGFAVRELPQSWLEALAPGGAIVAPIGVAGRTQRLTLFTKDAAGVVTSRPLAPVVYVADRGAPPVGEPTRGLL